jgi:ATP-dependent RNA helicase DDX49/DBP8
MKQALELSKKPHVVIATPGRLADHIKSSIHAAEFKRVKFLVMDEADRLLEPCFSDDITCILQSLPHADQRQTLLFSATMTSDMTRIQSMAIMTQTPFIYQGSEPYETLDHPLEQSYLLIPNQTKETYLYYLIKELWKDSSVIIFVAKCKTCERLRLMLRELQVNTTALHSFMSQHYRLASLIRFKSGIVNVLITTDVGARGLDLPSVQVVLNFDVPRSAKDYIHRIGRTARAGRGGIALTFVSEYDIELIQSIEKKIRKQLSEYEGLEEHHILTHLNAVTSARRVARMNMMYRQFGKRQLIHRQKKLYQENLEDDHNNNDNNASSNSPAS